MTLSRPSLTMSVLSDSYGNNSNADEQEAIRMRISMGNEDLSDAYDRTGNMKVARTLAKHSKPRMQKAGRYNMLTESIAGPRGFRNAAERFGYTDVPLVGNEEELIPPVPGGVQASNPLVPFNLGDYAPISENRLAAKNPIATTSPVANEVIENSIPATIPATTPSKAIAPTRRATSSSGLSIPEAKMEGTSMASLMEEPILPGQASLDKRIVTPGTYGEAEVDPSWWDLNRSTLGRGTRNLTSGLLAVAPHLGNIQRYEDMPGVPEAVMQKAVTTKAPDLESAKQAAISQGRQMANQAQYESPQDSVAARSKALSATQSALSQIAGQEEMMEQQWRDKNAQRQMAVDSRNISAIDRRNEMEVGRDLARTRGIGAEMSNISSKLLGTMGDIDRQRLDRERMNLVQQTYNLNDTLKRAAIKEFERTGKISENYANLFR